MQFRLYRWLTIIAGPLIDLYLTRRKLAGKEDPTRFRERLGHASCPRPVGSLVWFHAASIGESVSVLPMMKAIVEKYPNITILLTTGTVTSSSMLEDRLPKRVFHQYIPIDRLITVRRFLDHWRPDLAVFVESELWPNLIIETHATGCPLVQVNARISQNSFKKWSRYKSLAQKMLGCFSLSLAQSEEDKKRLEELGAPNAYYTGNLKFDAPPLPSDPKETGKMVTMIGERPIWLASSTHSGEEAIIANVHALLQEAHPDVLTIIVPRHPERGAEIAALCREKGLKTAMRSKDEPIGNGTSIYVADTVGELGMFYRLSGIVFMGGSLVEHGGQNPLEAARLECAIITGPHTQNFNAICEQMEKEEALIKINNEDELALHVGSLLSDHELHEKYTTFALGLVESKNGVLKAYLDELSRFLEPLVHIRSNDTVA